MTVIRNVGCYRDNWNTARTEGKIKRLLCEKKMGAKKFSETHRILQYLTDSAVSTLLTIIAMIFDAFNLCFL